MATRLESRMMTVTDLSTMSDELERAARGWSERRHLSKSAANVLRMVDLSARYRVLQLGSAYGSAARFLGEECALVDVLEPTIDRARLVRRRTADLSSVEVFIGALDALPNETSYDIVVVLGNTHEIAFGLGADSVDAVAAASRAVLRPGGTLMWVAQNRLGVSNLVRWSGDAREDTAGSTRAELDAALGRAGFTVQFLSVFPAVTNARVAMTDWMLDTRDERTLAWRLPRFPGATMPGSSPEFELWRAVVREGHGHAFPNAFLALAHRRGAQPAKHLWPATTKATFIGSERRADMMAKTVVRWSGEQLLLERFRLDGGGQTVRHGTLRLVLSDSVFVPGTDFAEMAAVAGPDELAALLRAWSLLVAAAKTENGRNIDLIPRNLIIGEDNSLSVIDEEFFDEGYSVQDVLARGILDVLVAIPPDAVPVAWGSRYEDVARHLGRIVGLEQPNWLDEAVDREAALKATIAGLDPGSPDRDDAIAQYQQRFRSLLDTRVGPPTTAPIWRHPMTAVKSYAGRSLRALRSIGRRAAR